MELIGFTIAPKITYLNYSKSFLFGFLEASLDKNPNVNKEMKKLTTV